MLGNKNFIFYDFETTGLNTEHCDLVELSFMITKDLCKFYKKKILIKYDKDYNKLPKSIKLALSVSRINNANDLKQHNLNAIPIDEAITFFINSIFKYFKEESFVIIGYNNKYYDNKVLNRFLNQYSQHSHIILKNTFDVLDFIKKSASNPRLSFEYRLKYFRSCGSRMFENYKLEHVYYRIYQNEFNAHDSLEDVRATLKVFLYYYIYTFELMQEHFKNSFNEFSLIENEFVDASNYKKEVENKC